MHKSSLKDIEMVQKSSEKSKESKKDSRTKISAIATIIMELKPGNTYSPNLLTDMIKERFNMKKKIHISTFTDIFDAIDTLKDLPFERIEKDGKFAGIKRIEEKTQDQIDRIQGDLNLIKKKLGIK